jgi:hypothetical protein
MSVVRFSEYLLQMTDDGHEPIIVPRHAEAKQHLRLHRAAALTVLLRFNASLSLSSCACGAELYSALSAPFTQ